MTTEETLEDLLGDEVFIEITNEGANISSKDVLGKSSVYKDHYRVGNFHFHPSKVIKFRHLDHNMIHITL